MKTNLVILAAGNSSRFQANKLLHPINDKAIIQYAFDACNKIAFHKVIVVTQYDEIKELALHYGYQNVMNYHPEKGLSHSIRLGVQASKECDQVMFLAADQPYIKQETLQTLLQMSDGEHILSASVDGVMKNPMLFPKSYYEELCNLTDDIGGKKVAMKWMDKVIKVEVDEIQLKDIDTKQDL